MKVSIDSNRLKQLESAAAKLSALEAGGVDNWEWYDESLKGYRETIEREEKLERLLEEIEVALFIGAYEPSERGAGFAASDAGRDEAMRILKTYNVRFGELT